MCFIVKVYEAFQNANFYKTYAALDCSQLNYLCMHNFFCPACKENKLCTNKKAAFRYARDKILSHFLSVTFFCKM